MKRLRTGLAYAGALLLLFGCKPIPTAPETNDDGGGASERTFTSEDWGFSISPPPDSLWSVSATQFRALREPNGLSPIQVIMRRVNPGFPTRPVLILDSFGASQTEPLEEVANSFDTLFAADFQNYNRQGQRVSGTVGGVPSLEWRFFAREPNTGLHLGNNLYLSVVFLRGDQIYTVLCSAQSGDFPVEAFRAILDSFTFNQS